MATDRLNEALADLNEAARERRDELSEMLNEKYADLKAMLSEAAGTSAGWLRDRGMEIGRAGKTAAVATDNSVRNHPYYYIGGTALAALLLGFMLGRHRDNGHA